MARRAQLELWHGRVLFLLFAWAACALGSVHPVVVAVDLGLAALTFAVGRFERGPLQHGPRMDGVGIALLALTAFTFLQAIPLPPGLVRFLSPRAFDLHDGAWAALGSDHRAGWFALSVDPPATLLAGIKMLAVSLTYLTVRFRIRAHGGRSVLGPLVAAGAAVAIVYFLHRFAGWTRVYDEYVPRHAAFQPLSAPFLNPNHLAGMLGLTAALAFGLALSAVDRFRRATMILAGATAGGACLMTLSRGGIIAFVAGQALFLVLRSLAGKEEPAEPRMEEALPPRGGEEPAGRTGDDRDSAAPRKSAEPRGRHLAWASLGGVLALAAGSYVAYGAIVREFETGTAAKVEIARDALPMALDFPLAGAGRGAFLAAFPPYQTQPDVWTYTHPENIAAQYLTEWGLPVGALALLGLLFVLGRAALRPPIRAYNAAAIAAAFALLLQNTVDFSLEYLGAALPFIAVLAVVREVGAVGDRERVRRRSHPRLRLPGPVWFALPLATVAVLVWVYPRAAAQDLDAESGRFRLYAAADEYHPRMLDDAREAFARHPADYFLPYLAGLHLARSGHGSPIAFWNQALRLRPNSSAVHYAVATWLARFPATRGQAAGEFGLAVRCRPDVLPHAADAVARVLPEFSRTEEFVRLARPDPLPVWNALAAAYERLGRTAAAAAADRAILEAAPGHPQARFRRAAAALGDGRPGEAIDHLRRCSFFGFRHAERFLLEARALTALGHATEAVALLERAIAVVDSPEIPTALADLHVALGDLDAAERALAVLEARARTQADRSDAVVRRVRILVKAEHFADAFTQTRRTLGIDPGRVDLWVLAADLAERLDDIPGELWALRELVRRRPKDEALRERLRAVEARATEIRVLQYR